MLPTQCVQYMCSVWFLQQTVITLYSLQRMMFVMLADRALCKAWPSINVTFILPVVKVKVKWSCYRPGVAQRVGRVVALLFHDRGTRRGWVVSSTPRPHFTPRKDPVQFYRRLGGPQGRSGRVENLVPTGIWSRTVQPVVQSLYRLSYWAHILPAVPC